MFELDVRSRKPVYEQLMDKFKELMIADVLQENERLPSVRTLAKQLTINPNTIQKAFRQLEIEGYIYTIPGKGSFVSPPKRVKTSEKEKKIKQELAKVIGEALYMGIKEEEIHEMIQSIRTGAWGEQHD